MMQLECNGMLTTDVVFQTLAGEMEFDILFGGKWYQVLLEM